ncbi:MAG: hypothetical protein AB4041_17275 [Microcystaceae cyanobacterium]
MMYHIALGLKYSTVGGAVFGLLLGIPYWGIVGFMGDGSGTTHHTVIGLIQCLMVGALIGIILGLIIGFIGGLLISLS